MMKIAEVNNYPVFKGNLFLKDKNNKELKINTKDILSIKEKESNLTGIYTACAIYTVNSPLNKIVNALNLADNKNIDIHIKDSTSFQKLC